LKSEAGRRGGQAFKDHEWPLSHSDESFSVSRPRTSYYFSGKQKITTFEFAIILTNHDDAQNRISVYKIADRSKPFKLN